MGYIYKITNIITNTIYIGQTTEDDVNVRWKYHLRNGSNCRLLKNAIKEYGKQSFIFTIICICFDEDLNRFEIDYINKLNSLYPNGYNLRHGGNHGKHSQETCEKISKSLKTGYKNNLIHKSYIGHKCDEETRKKISLSLKKYHKENKQTIIYPTRPSRYKVIRSKDGIDIETYENSKEASQKLGVSVSSICMACKGKRNKLLGFTFRYETILQ